MELNFTHGQLYVMVSRVPDGANLGKIAPDINKARQGKIENVVYTEIFN